MAEDEIEWSNERIMQEAHRIAVNSSDQYNATIDLLLSMRSHYLDRLEEANSRCNCDCGPCSWCGNS